MVQICEYTVMLFYSNINQESLQTRVMLNEFIENHHYPVEIILKEVDYEKEKNLSHQYGVMGTPAVLFLKNGNLIRRHFGEITSEEFKSIFKSVSNI